MKNENAKNQKQTHKVHSAFLHSDDLCTRSKKSSTILYLLFRKLMFYYYLFSSSTA
jgi:hypothetical protein